MPSKEITSFVVGEAQFVINFKEVQQAEGKLISEPEEFGEGYYGFVFADPDGHRFNVFFM